jgi:hypothetical protein
MTDNLCHTPKPCQYLGKGGTCLLHALYGPDVCWRRDGRVVRKVGLQESESPFEGGGEE